MDSHADTCVVDKNALIVHKLNKQVNVTGFDPSQGKVKNLDLVSAALTYDCPTSGEATILMVHQAVHVPTMENDLLLSHANANEYRPSQRMPQVYGASADRHESHTESLSRWRRTRIHQFVAQHATT